MKNSEIRALVDEAKADLAYCEEHINLLPMYDFKMTMRLTSAIETLLAREAEVMGMLPEPPDGYMSETQYARAQLGDQIRAILNPEENDK